MHDMLKKATYFLEGTMALQMDDLVSPTASLSCTD